jgi:quercetin dioxygenase-like cupin family protein
VTTLIHRGSHLDAVATTPARRASRIRAPETSFSKAERQLTDSREDGAPADNEWGRLVSMAYLAQPEQQQQLEWLDGGTLAILLDGKATDGQLMVGRFDVSEGEAPPYHKHTHEDEVFMLIKGTALLWYDDQEMALSEGGIVFLPKNIPHAYRITSKKADLLMINTPAGIEGMFRFAGRDRATPRPEGFGISPERMAEGADKFGQIILGPPR